MKVLPPPPSNRPAFKALGSARRRRVRRRRQCCRPRCRYLGRSRCLYYVSLPLREPSVLSHDRPGVRWCAHAVFCRESTICFVWTTAICLMHLSVRHSMRQRLHFTEKYSRSSLLLMNLRMIDDLLNSYSSSGFKQAKQISKLIGEQIEKYSVHGFNVCSVRVRRCQPLIFQSWIPLHLFAC